ncbi:atrial natriuretic peptide receptor 1-like [Paramacrobiotus metropolitanus]|uniref:atrial natriuretic peptide receptor 1-like n=1 Tax=Paramacrobiotus metropolitanus TaxID=2943436 RepID=UPI0024465CA4|nr:atrial natriuretic peptide receptor 1-like [Paramacrobiotus metropolitanus]
MRPVPVWPALTRLLLTCMCTLRGTQGQPRRVVFLSVHAWTSLPYSVDYVGAPIALAVEELNRAAELHNQTDRFSVISWNKTALRTCTDVQVEAVPYAADVYLRGSWRRSPDDVFVILAPSCSEAVAYLGDLAREWNVPVISSGGTDTVLDDKRRFPTLLRLSPYQQQMLAEVIVALLRFFRWTDVALLCDEGATELNTFSLICKVLPVYFKKTPGIAPVFLKYNFKTNPDHRRFLTEAARSARVFIVSTHGSRLRQLLIVAERLGMANGDFAFIGLAPFVSPFVGKMSWQYGDADDAAAYRIYRYLLLIASVPSRQTAALTLYQRIKERSWTDYGLRYEPDEEVTLFASGYYLAVQVVAQVLAAFFPGTTADRTGPVSGIDLARSTYNRTFATQMGALHINARGDLDNDYGVKALLAGSDQFQVAFRWMRETGDLVPVDNARWPLNTTPPVNRPWCGFTGQDPRCRNETNILTLAGIGVAASVGCLTVILVAGCAWIRYQQSNSVDWLVSPAEVQHSSRTTKTLSVLTKSQMLRAPMVAHMDGGRTRVATYRGHAVWCRVVGTLNKATKLPRDFIRDTNVRRRLKQSSLAEFMGAVVEGSYLLTLTEYFAKGSLDDVIELKPAWMDAQLKNVFLTDIVNGLSVIHAAADLRSHGALKSPNCMVTGHLSIKLADFGYPAQQLSRLREALAKEQYNGLLWTAPEVLRAPRTLSPEADIYSLGIVFQEVLLMARPFASDLSDAEIVLAVKKPSEPPYRPALETSAVAAEMAQLMERCWAENCRDRPRIGQVKQVLARISGLKPGGHFMEMVMRKLREYAEELEEQVAERTQGLLAEKKRSEDLLRNMLPGSIVEALVRGVSVEAEVFASCTVAFSGVVHFGALVCGMTPWDCVALLNEFFSAFDQLIGEYDAYKVETIGDTYMLASGVPVRNGNLHAEQLGLLCCGALALVERCSFAGRKLQLQMGLHSGPLAAGLVGLRMMRYCLFGDTVNMASRMTSTSLPQRLQASESSKLILDTSQVLRCQSRGTVQVKGKGLIETFWISRGDGS